MAPSAYPNSRPQSPHWESVGVGRREQEESKLLRRQQLPFISICKGLGELQMEAAQAGSLLGLKIELVAPSRPRRRSGWKGENAQPEVEEADRVLEGASRSAGPRRAASAREGQGQVARRARKLGTSWGPFKV